MKPIVDIIIPTYNYAEKVTRAIASVMEQTFNNLQCYIVDDESKDNTEQVVREFIQHDKRFHYIKQKNSGVAGARNFGISQGEAPYVCCLDADDAIAPLFLEACIRGLEADRDISLAYTGLQWVKPSGTEGIGNWPSKFDYDSQLKGKNQIPTCCVFSRVMWERLGGYRKRYCPHGAGSEDAEFWLRAGAYGFKAKQVTDAPLFIYSFLTGGVSGNPDYREVNWMSLHPWTKDMRHPFPSIATPRKHSHPVHAYDTPVISVIIPVSKQHTSYVFDALDSLEGQTFRDWEAIVVNDSGSDKPWEFDRFPDAMRAYPYVRMISTGGEKGAGYARNRGAEIARAPLLLFLDADDTLMTDALEEMAIAWGLEQSVIYSNYAGKAFISEDDYNKFPRDDRMFYDKKTNLAVIRHHAAEYECAQAILEPTKKMYIWNLITSLVPKAWHEEIKGFDEKMKSWEDWDYWIRMARAGKCFYKLNKDLVVYRFYTGTRRERGLQDHESLIQYMINKYNKEQKTMPCNCGGKKQNILGNSPQVQRVAPSNVEYARKDIKNMANPQESDKDFVLCVYTHPNVGQHKVVGAATRRIYGYRGGGDKFYVDRRDIAAQPNLFRIIEDVLKISDIPAQPVKVVAPKPVEPEISPDIMQREVSDLQNIPGVTPSIRSQLNASNVHTVKELVEFGEEKLATLKGVAEKRAHTIIEFSKQYLEKNPE